MSYRIRFVVDRDYLTKASDIRTIAQSISHLAIPKLHWDSDRPADWFTELSIDDFYEVQSELPSMGLAVDLFHHTDDMFLVPRATGRFTRRLRRPRLLSPREYAREHFADWRTIFYAQTQRGANLLTAQEEEALRRVYQRKEVVLHNISIDRQIRFVRVGLELAESDHERAAISDGHLREVIVSISTDIEFDMVAHECSLSPLLLDACRDFVSIDEADWNSELKERWYLMLAD